MKEIAGLARIFIVLCWINAADAFQLGTLELYRRQHHRLPYKLGSFMHRSNSHDRFSMMIPRVNTCHKRKLLECKSVGSSQDDWINRNIFSAEHPLRFLQHLVVMGLCGAALGPFLDGYHSAFGVLAYTKPISVSLAQIQLFQTDYWVPPMFALAAIILGVSYPYLDKAFDVPSSSRAPSVPTVLSCISYFSFQYYLSGLLFSQDCSPALLHLILASTAAANWAIFDRTPTGAVMSAVTGLAGPLVEVALLNVAPAVVGGPLYHYTAPDALGIPLWIGWVYACGAPAVGNLARLFWSRP
jgi:hypothetical protein